FAFPLVPALRSTDSASQSCGIKTMGRVPRLALERGRYQGEPEHYLPHRTQGTEKREGPALYPEEQNRQPYPSASRISCSDLEPSSDATSDREPSSHSTPMAGGLGCVLDQNSAGR